MIPTTVSYDDFVSFSVSDETKYPSFTYKLLVLQDRTYGKVDSQDALKQAIYKRLNTERYEHEIYSDDFGVEFNDLIGEHIAYVIPEIERRIRDSLLRDARILRVFDFNFETKKKIVHVTFKCDTVFGEFATETEVIY